MSLALFGLAAIAEIAGCFAFWAWWKQGASGLWLIAGMVALAVFAQALAMTPPDAAGRAFAAYGGVYIACALLWLWLVEGQGLRSTDLLGAGLALTGAGVILWGAIRG